MAYSAWSVVANEQPSVAKWNILGANDASFNDGTGIAVSAITPEKLLTGTGTTWPWTTFTPSWTNLTVGNGTSSSWLKQVGKTVHLRMRFTWGSTTSGSGSTPYFTAPVAMNTTGFTANVVMCIGTALDVGVGSYRMFGRYASAGGGSIELVAESASGTYVSEAGVTSTVPFTWATGDIMFLTGTYEAA